MLDILIARIRYLFKKPEWYSKAKSELTLFFESPAAPELSKKDIDICINKLLNIMFEIQLASLPISNNCISYIIDNLIKDKTLLKNDPSDNPDSNKMLLNNMNNTELLIFLNERCNLPLCRFCRNFMASPRNPDVCGWRGKKEKCQHGFSSWLRDTNPEGEMDAIIE